MNILSRFETSRLFFPVKATEHWVSPGPVGLAAEAVELQTSTRRRIHACAPARTPIRAARVLYSHGNAGNLSHRPSPSARCSGMCRCPYHLRHPGYGHSPPRRKTCYASADAAYDWLVRVKGVPPEKIVLFGESLGGGPSTELATRRPFRMLVLARTFTSIPDMAQVFFPYLPARWFVFNHFDNLAKIDRCLGPVFIAHGDCDRLIPYEQGVRLFVKAREPKRFFHMAGFEHADPLAPAFYESLRDFLAETAPAAKTEVSRS